MALVIYHGGLKLQLALRAYSHSASDMLWQIVKARCQKYEKQAPIRDEAIWDHSVSFQDLDVEDSEEVWHGIFDSLFHANEDLYAPLRKKKRENWDKALVNATDIVRTDRNEDAVPAWRRPLIATT